MRTAAERPDIHALLACLVGLVMAAPPAPAFAWSFPEHVHITALAFDRYITPEARAVLAAKVQSVSTASRGSQERNSGLLPLCEELTIPFERLPSHEPRCIAFNVLPALAGDHSIDTDSLRAALYPSKRRIPPVSASRYPRGPSERRPLADVAFDVAEMFSAFLANAPREARRTFKEPTFDRARSDESGDDVRRMFLRQVDLYLRAEDPGYTDRAGGARAHFQDASAPIEATISLAARAGDLDNALAQVLAHHLRSLQYAARAGTDAKLVSEALLEHAFALHFLQDAFAAGHIGTEPAIFGDISRLRRHDFLNRVGLPVSRVMMRQSCHPDSIDADREAEQNCWTAYGDGYLDSTNAIRTAEAAAHLSLQLAMAFDADLAQNLLEGCPSVIAASTQKSTDTPCLRIERVDADNQAKLRDDPKRAGACETLIRTADLLDPRPQWLRTPGEQALRQSWTTSDIETLARQIVAGASAALAALERLPDLRATQSGNNSSSQPDRIPVSIVDSAFNPCSPNSAWSARQHPLCGVEGVTFRFGEIGGSLVRPLLTYWPGPTATIRSVSGQDAFGAGLAFQVMMGAGVAVGVDSQVPIAFSGSFGAGLALRADHLLPGRLNREVLGLNVAAAPLLLTGMDADRPADVSGARYKFAGFAELRVPVIPLIGAWTTGRVAELGPVQLGPTGFRLYWLWPVTVPHDAFVLMAWDIELVNIRLAPGTASRTASLGAGTDTELRLRLGAFQPGKLDPSFRAAEEIGWVPMVAVEVASGYSFYILEFK